MSIMDQVKKNLREWYALAADRTGDMAKISVRMYDKYGISREIERQLSEFGSYVYHAVEDGRVDFEGDAGFQAAIDRIKALELDLDAKVGEIDEIRVQRQQKQEAQKQAETAAPATESPVDDGLDSTPTDDSPPAAAAEASPPADIAETPSDPAFDRHSDDGRPPLS